MTILESLKNINTYPIPNAVIEVVAIKRGLDINSEVNSEILNSNAYLLATADIMKWLGNVPKVSQSDVNFSLLEKNQDDLKELADDIYSELEPPKKIISNFGYKGNKL
ncbi:MAG: hypothetical protein LBV69_00030 [Bacteroidales bacterium]|nr:hypothetical protein [Bacteroidales bacterium]